jgi:DNA-directed RNA polymerase subunit H (RpoH/RPB5)
MNYETIDILYRSRITLLDHLESVGYKTTPFRKFSHKEVGEMVKAGPINGAPPALWMELERKQEATTPGQPTKCFVVYTLGRIKQKIEGFTQKLIDPEETEFNPETTELIIITMEPLAPNFHAMAYQLYMNKGVRVRYFQAAAMINNPLHHQLVPKHEKLPKEEEEPLMKSMYAKKSQLPIIRFHEDPIARWLGLLPDDVVKITRPSPTAGETVVYRLCRV